MWRYYRSNIYVSIFLSVDEVGALVFDIGSYSFRAGYAGEDSPKVSGSSFIEGKKTNFQTSSSFFFCNWSIFLCYILLLVFLSFFSKFFNLDQPQTLHLIYFLTIFSSLLIILHLNYNSIIFYLLQQQFFGYRFPIFSCLWLEYLL